MSDPKIIVSFILMAVLSVITLLTLQRAFTYSLDDFLDETSALVANGKLDPLLFERFAVSPLETDANKHEEILRNIYINTVVDAVALYEVYVDSTVTHIAVNEPYTASDPYLFVYIVPVELETRTIDLGLKCSARAYRDKRVVFIDERLLHAISQGVPCSDETPSLWLHPSVEVYESDNHALTVGAVEIYEIALRLPAILLIAHELSHLIMHSDGSSYPIEKALIQTGISEYGARESEADDLAVRLIINSLAQRGDSIIDDIAHPRYREAIQTLAVAFIHLKSNLSRSGELALFESKGCDHNLFLSHRIYSIVVSLTKFQFFFIESTESLEGFDRFESYYQERLRDIDRNIQNCL